MEESKGEIVATELSFLRDDEKGIELALCFWDLAFFLPLQFTTELKKLVLEQEESVV